MGHIGLCGRSGRLSVAGGYTAFVVALRTGELCYSPPSATPASRWPCSWGSWSGATCPARAAQGRRPDHRQPGCTSSAGARPRPVSQSRKPPALKARSVRTTSAESVRDHGDVADSAEGANGRSLPHLSNNRSTLPKPRMKSSPSVPRLGPTTARAAAADATGPRVACRTSKPLPACPRSSQRTDRGAMYGPL